ncbi:MAG TPA: nitrilase-related carbon-nitrogen hydrolase [Methanomicrobiales archaeon]|jgi:predicted amidohydrolase|nr:nitrilase-related carbon-nitrogen hydrolase [Methanomicrobiales archaeon]
MKVCTAQLESAWEDPRATLRKASRCVASAKEQGAELVLFPEQFVTGWSPNSTRFAEGPGDSTVKALRGLARDHGVFLVGSYVERHEPLPLNTSIAIDPRGEVVASFSKIHPFSPGGEDNHYGRGDHLSVFISGGVRFGIAICYDLRFAPLFRAYALAGVHGVLVPSAWPCSRTRAWEVLVQARALDNQFYVIGCNPTGTTPVDRYCGHSLSADPVGAVIARGGEGEELVMTEVDQANVEAARARMPVEKDRRPDLYHRLFEGRRH